MLTFVFLNLFSRNLSCCEPYNMTLNVFCEYCALTVPKEDLYCHVESFHVGFRSKGNLFFIKCGDCEFNACEFRGGSMIEHCFRVNHRPSAITTDWNNFITQETDRIRSIITTGVEVLKEQYSSTASDPPLNRPQQAIRSTEKTKAGLVSERYFSNTKDQSRTSSRNSMITSVGTDDQRTYGVEVLKEEFSSRSQDSALDQTQQANEGPRESKVGHVFEPTFSHAEDQYNTSRRNTISISRGKGYQRTNEDVNRIKVMQKRPASTLPSLENGKSPFGIVTYGVEVLKEQYSSRTYDDPLDQSQLATWAPEKSKVGHAYASRTHTGSLNTIPASCGTGEDVKRIKETQKRPASALLSLKDERSARGKQRFMRSESEIETSFPSQMNQPPEQMCASMKNLTTEQIEDKESPKESRPSKIWHPVHEYFCKTESSAGAVVICLVCDPETGKRCGATVRCANASNLMSHLKVHHRRVHDDVRLANNYKKQERENQQRQKQEREKQEREKQKREKQDRQKQERKKQERKNNHKKQERPPKDNLLAIFETNMM